MNIDTIKRLNKLNSDFYNTTAIDFDDSRQFFWQGWSKLIPFFEKFNQLKLLDFGCGNSRFFKFISANFEEKTIDYLGIDNNTALLKFGDDKFSENQSFSIKNIDIISATLEEIDFIEDEKYKLIVSFGLFHHIPTIELKIKILNYLKSKLDDDGLIIISLWQFMDFDRLRKKAASKKTLKDLGLDKLEKNDYILDWKRGRNSLRYCHFIDDLEQNELIEKSGLNLIDSFKADGKEGSVNKYLVLGKYE